MPGDARSVLSLIKSAGLGSCARGDTTDNIPHETQALELFGTRHMRALGSNSRADSNTSPCFSAADKEVVCTKKVRSETDVLREAGDGNSSHVRHHTHTWTGGCFGSFSRDQQPFPQLWGAELSPVRSFVGKTKYSVKCLIEDNSLHIFISPG